MTRRQWAAATVTAVILGVGLAGVGHLRSGGNPDDLTVASGRTTDTLPSYEGLDLGLPAATTIPSEATEPTTNKDPAHDVSATPPQTGVPRQGRAPAGAPVPAPSGAPAATPRRAPAPTPPPCRNSFEPRCGDFLWDPSPPNASARIEVRFDPPQPRAGQPVTVTLRGEDPDALTGSFTFNSNCRSDTFGICNVSVLPGCGPVPGTTKPYGRWDPPTPPSTHLRLSVSWSVVFDTPGNHAYTAGLATSGATPDSWRGLNPCDLPRSPYNSTAERTGMINVSS